MAVVGFFTLLLIGLMFVGAAIAGAVVTTGFSGKIEWPHFISFGGIGGVLLYIAVTHCPFQITIG